MAGCCRCCCGCGCSLLRRVPTVATAGAASRLQELGVPLETGVDATITSSTTTSSSSLPSSSSSSLHQRARPVNFAGASTSAAGLASEVSRLYVDHANTRTETHTHTHTHTHKQTNTEILYVSAPNFHVNSRVRVWDVCAQVLRCGRLGGAGEGWACYAGRGRHAAPHSERAAQREESEEWGRVRVRSEGWAVLRCVRVAPVYLVPISSCFLRGLMVNEFFLAHLLAHLLAPSLNRLRWRRR